MICQKMSLYFIMIIKKKKKKKKRTIVYNLNTTVHVPIVDYYLRKKYIT
jgi:hypothetical protein